MPYTHCGSVVRAINIYCPVVQLTTTGSWPSGQTQTTLLYCYCNIVATNQLTHILLMGVLRTYCLSQNLCVYLALNFDFYCRASHVLKCF